MAQRPNTSRPAGFKIINQSDLNHCFNNKILLIILYKVFNKSICAQCINLIVGDIVYDCFMIEF